MSTLVLQLRGPLQAWGAASRFVRRTTEPQPTKSGVLGLLAAALGRRRSDPIEDLLGLRFGVRTDQPGRLLRDFQTARSLDGAHSMPLSYRFYLADAAFLAVVEGERGLIDGLADALRHPAFPLYLGRRSCPPSSPVYLGVRDEDVMTVVRSEPWRASPWWQKRTREESVRLDIAVDADCVSGASPAGMQDSLRDVPLSFDPELRSYGWRTVYRDQVTVANPFGRRGMPDESGHEPLALVGGS